MTSDNVTLTDVIGVLYHVALNQNRNAVFIWSVDLWFIFIEQINIIFMRPVYDAVILCHCIINRFAVWVCQLTIALVCVMFLMYYAPNFEEVDRAYWFRVVHAWRVLKFHIWIPHWKISDAHCFSYPSYLPFWSYAPWKKSKWNLMHAISYEPVHARWKNSLMHIFFSCPVSLSGVMSLWKNQNVILSENGPLKIWAFWKNQNEIFSARYIKKYLS